MSFSGVPKWAPLAILFAAASVLAVDNLNAQDGDAQAQIPVVAESVGGRFGRKLLFRIPDGDVWVKTV